MSADRDFHVPAASLEPATLAAGVKPGFNSCLNDGGKPGQNIELLAVQWKGD